MLLDGCGPVLHFAVRQNKHLLRDERLQMKTPSVSAPADDGSVALAEGVGASIHPAPCGQKLTARCAIWPNGQCQVQLSANQCRPGNEFCRKLMQRLNHKDFRQLTKVRLAEFNRIARSVPGCCNECGSLALTALRQALAECLFCTISQAQAKRPQG